MFLPSDHSQSSPWPPAFALIRPMTRNAIALAVLWGIWPVLATGGGFRSAGLFAASALFVLLGLCGRWDHPGLRIPLRLGLVACAAGDVLGPRNFQVGVLCFLLAHLAFSVGCLAHGVEWGRAWRWSPVVVLASLGLVGWWLWPHLPDRDRPLIAAYTAVISVMAWLASGLRSSPVSPWLWTGAWIFYLSDIFVARWRFVDPSSTNGLICYPLYYLACALLACAAGKDLQPPSPLSSGGDSAGSPR